MHRQVGVGIGGDLREHMWCNGSTLVQNTRDVSSIPILGTIFPIFITPRPDTDCHDLDPVQAMCCMVVEPTLCMFM